MIGIEGFEASLMIAYHSRATVEFQHPAIHDDREVHIIGGSYLTVLTIGKLVNKLRVIRRGSGNKIS